MAVWRTNTRKCLYMALYEKFVTPSFYWLSILSLDNMVSMRKCEFVYSQVYSLLLYKL